MESFLATTQTFDTKGQSGCASFGWLLMALEAYLSQLQLESAGACLFFFFIINENHEFVLSSLNTQVYSSSGEMGYETYIETEAGAYTPNHKSYVDRKGLLELIGRYGGIFAGELNKVRSQLMWTLLGMSITSCLSLLGK